MKLEIITKIVFILAIVINARIVKTKASFLIIWALGTWLNNSFLIIVLTNDLIYIASWLDLIFIVTININTINFKG